MDALSRGATGEVDVLRILIHKPSQEDLMGSVAVSQFNFNSAFFPSH